ncbi:Cysteine-rich secretory protein 1, partial [Cricetulus griseus]
LKLQRALYNNLVTEFQTKPQEEIVKAHNVLRRTVYPTARNMLKMSWNKAAATNARILARYCDMSDSDPLERRLNVFHSDCHVILPFFDSHILDDMDYCFNDIIFTPTNICQRKELFVLDIIKES